MVTPELGDSQKAGEHRTYGSVQNLILKCKYSLSNSINDPGEANLHSNGRIQPTFAEQDRMLAGLGRGIGRFFSLGSEVWRGQSRFTCCSTPAWDLQFVWLIRGPGRKVSLVYTRVEAQFKKKGSYFVKRFSVASEIYFTRSFGVECAAIDCGGVGDAQYSNLGPFAKFAYSQTEWRIPFRDGLA
jgi:hypothetical protein